MKKEREKKTIRSQNHWVLLCHSSKPPLVCGVYASRKEAKEANEPIKTCPAGHQIVKCNIIIHYDGKEKVLK